MPKTEAHFPTQGWQPISSKVRPDWPKQLPSHERPRPSRHNRRGVSLVQILAWTQPVFVRTHFRSRLRSRNLQNPLSDDVASCNRGLTGEACNDAYFEGDQLL